MNSVTELERSLVCVGLFVSLELKLIVSVIERDSELKFVGEAVIVLERCCVLVLVLLVDSEFNAVELIDSKVELAKVDSDKLKVGSVIELDNIAEVER